MKLASEFYRLPLRFDVERLRAEALAFASADWQKHPTGYAGNTAIRLITAGGRETDDVGGAMGATPALARCPYIRQVLAHFGVVWSRSRLMKLGPKSEVPEHCDINHHWFHRVRIHIPIATFPEVRFHCGRADVHMAAGEAWIFDNWRRHRVVNPTDHERIHLVADTMGSAPFWAMIGSAQASGFDAWRGLEPQPVPWRPGESAEVATEQVNAPPILHPAEIEILASDLRRDLAITEDSAGARRAAAEFQGLLDGLCREWRRLWSLFGDGPAGWPWFMRLREATLRQLETLPPVLHTWSNDIAVGTVLRARILDYAINVPASSAAREVEYGARPASRPARPAPREAFDRPLFVVAAPRSGSTLLFETLSCSTTLWTVGGETHTLIEGVESLRPGAPGVDSNRLQAQHASGVIADHLCASLLRELRTADRRGYAGGRVRFLEKTPKNALRIPFFDAIFPDARFIFLWRDPAENISSIMDAWRSGGWVTYSSLPGWDGPWSLLLPPGWQQLRGRPLEEVAAYQWECTNRTILDDLAQLDPTRWCALGYAEFVANPASAVAGLCDFAGVPFDGALQARTAAALPPSRYTLSAPDPEKWHKNEAAIERVRAGVAGTLARLQSLRSTTGVAKKTAAEAAVS